MTFSRWKSLVLTLAAVCGCAATKGTTSQPPVPPVGNEGAPAVCSWPAGIRLVERRSEPKLFVRGADPSGDPACRDVVNPERGFFAFRNLLAMDDVAELRASGVSLVYGQALLDGYRDRAIDARLEDKARTGFQVVRAAGLKVLPRFYYAADDKAPDARPARALEHIKALGPLLRDNADVIAAMHAGFLGAWGEWHPEERATLAERKRILEALLEELPPSRSIVVRRPFYKQMSFGGPVTSALAHSHAALARVGHLNDCFLASPNDQGTYRAVGEEDYSLSDARYVPVGGETCAVNPPRSECGSATHELERHHWSFLNRDFQEQVLDSWRQGGCYDTIACRLGYRFVVRGHAQPAEVRVGAPLAVRVSLTNDGYAAPYNPRPVFLALDAGQGPVFVPTGTDARTWAPGQDAEACLAATVPSGGPTGSVRIGLWLPDPEPSLQRDPRYAIRLTGGVAYDAATGVNWLDGPITVSALGRAADRPEPL